jgi:hypothetical protein
MKSTIFLTILLAIAGLSINAQNNSQLISYPKNSPFSRLKQLFRQ